MINMQPIKKSDASLIKEIRELSEEIWKEHYAEITGLEQIEYMLKKFFSKTSIEKQIDEKYEFYLINFQNKPIGYISLQNRNDYLFLSKFYILKSYRGKGLGRLTMSFIKEQAKTFNLKKIRLTVHKQNPTLKSYEAFGFKVLAPIVTDIGNGYIMDDYTMELSL